MSSSFKMPGCAVVGQPTALFRSHYSLLYVKGTKAEERRDGVPLQNGRDDIRTTYPKPNRESLTFGFHFKKFSCFLQNVQEDV